MDLSISIPTEGEYNRQKAYIDPTRARQLYLENYDSYVKEVSKNIVYNGTVRYLIRSGLSKEQLDYVINKTLAKDIQFTLKAIHKGKSQVYLISLFKEFFDMKWTPRNSVNKIATILTNLQESIRELNLE